MTRDQVGISADVLDSVELSRFREEWKAELRSRAHVHRPSLSITTSDGLISPPPKPKESPDPLVVTPAYTRAHHSGYTSNATHTSKGLSRALEVYQLAVQNEQEGLLDKTLDQYRQAFRLNSHVDKAYHKEELRLAALAESKGLAVAADNENVVDTHDLVAKAVSNCTSLGATEDLSGVLERSINGFPPDLTFEREDERHRVLIAVLPDELLAHCLSWLDASSIERFALVNRKARIVSLENGIWRRLVQSTYVPPQTTNVDLIEDLVPLYRLNYRRFYIEHPRLRLDGVYIAVCHYVRPGLSENAWVHISHLVTYHRYLRFLPDGQVLSLLANEEVEPQTVIPMLKPTLRMKGLLVGTWALDGTTVTITDLQDRSGSVVSRYTFQMTLSLRSRPLGRWNKLDFSGYYSINRESGETTPIALKHERPFWFSKVRSYAM